MTRRHWHVAEFDSPDGLRGAVEQLVGRGARIVEACSPYEVPGLAARLGKRRTAIPRIGFIGGLVGAVLAYAIQWYVNAWDYPLNVGGRPPHAVPSFIFVTFETLVLCAGLSIFFGTWFLLGLPRYYHPLWEVDGFDRVSSDRFWLVVEAPADEAPFDGIDTRRIEKLEVRM